MCRERHQMLPQRAQLENQIKYVQQTRALPIIRTVLAAYGDPTSDTFCWHREPDIETMTTCICVPLFHTLLKLTHPR